MEHNLFNTGTPEPGENTPNPIDITPKPKLPPRGWHFHNGYLVLLRNPVRVGKGLSGKLELELKLKHVANIANFCWFNKIAPTRLIYMECW